jgi:hypothetical protein
MADYDKIAEKARMRQDAATLPQVRRNQLEAHAKAFFQRTSTHIEEEMNKANVALRKRKVDTIARNRLPNFEDAVFLAIGTEALCRVELDLKTRIPRITAVIIGPPHRAEIARRTYMLAMDASGKEMPNIGRAGWPTLGASPKEIAEQIIAGIVSGRFE